MAGHVADVNSSADDVCKFESGTAIGVVEWERKAIEMHVRELDE